MLIPTGFLLVGAATRAPIAELAVRYDVPSYDVATLCAVLERDPYNPRVAKLPGQVRVILYRSCLERLKRREGSIVGRILPHVTAPRRAPTATNAPALALVAPAPPEAGESVELTFRVRVSGCRVRTRAAVLKLNGKSITYQRPGGEGKCQKFLGYRRVTVGLGRLPAGTYTVEGPWSRPFVFTVSPKRLRSVVTDCDGCRVG